MKLLACYLRLTTPKHPAWYALPLRLIVGYGVMEHGYAKLARGPENFAAILHALGTPMPELLARATIAAELFGGLAVLLGLFIPLASLPMAVVLLVAIATVHLPNGFSSIKLLSVDAAGAHFGQPGYETDLLYLAGLARWCWADPGLGRWTGCFCASTGPRPIKPLTAYKITPLSRPRPTR